VTTKAIIDRETNESFSINVLASDGVDTSTSLVYVTVLDDNDNYPKFINFTHDVSIREGNFTDSPYPVIHIYATDEDIGPNGNVTYSLESNYNIFEINKYSVSSI